MAVDARPAYSVPILYTAGATDAAGSYVWAIRNGANPRLLIRRVVLSVGFNALTALATSSDVQIVRLTGLSALSGGTALTAAKLDPASAASGITACQTNAVLVATGGVVDATHLNAGNARSNGAVGSVVFDATDRFGSPIEIPAGAGNGIALRLNVIAATGDTVRGFVEWSEA